MSNGVQERKKASTGACCHFLSYTLLMQLYIHTALHELIQPYIIKQYTNTPPHLSLPLPRRPRLRLHNRLPPPARRPAQNPRPAIRRPLHHYQPCPAPDPRWPQTCPSPLARHNALGDPHGVRQRPLLRHAKQHAHVRRSSAQLTGRSRRDSYQRSGCWRRDLEYFVSAA